MITSLMISRPRLLLHAAFFAGVSYSDRPIRPTQVPYKEKEHFVMSVKLIVRWPALCRLPGLAWNAHRLMPRSMWNGLARLSAESSVYDQKPISMSRIDELEIFDTNGQTSPAHRSV